MAVRTVRSLLLIVSLIRSNSASEMSIRPANLGSDRFLGWKSTGTPIDRPGR